MVKGIRVHKVGGPEALVYEEFELAQPNEVGLTKK